MAGAIGSSYSETNESCLWIVIMSMVVREASLVVNNNNNYQPRIRAGRTKNNQVGVVAMDILL